MVGISSSPSITFLMDKNKTTNISETKKEHCHGIFQILFQNDILVSECYKYHQRNCSTQAMSRGRFQAWKGINVRHTRSIHCLQLSQRNGLPLRRPWSKGPGLLKVKWTRLIALTTRDLSDRGQYSGFSQHCLTTGISTKKGWMGDTWLMASWRLKRHLLRGATLVRYFQQCNQEGHQNRLCLSQEGVNMKKWLLDDLW